MKNENKKSMSAKRTADMHTELRRLNEERAGALAERDEAVANAKHATKAYTELKASHEALKAQTT